MKENKEMRLEYMAEVVGKTNDTVVQCKNCKCLVKYAKSDVEYTSTHFSKSNIEFSTELICPCCHNILAREPMTLVIGVNGVYKIFIDTL